jgi:teichuronic acid biosynthesis glycosyltransferase TuaG
MPAYNAAAHIGEALESVRAQTYEDWEVVVADDGSTDDSAAIARGFGERVKVVPAPGQSGPATARNVAIGASHGELLAFLDADDEWLPDYLQRQVALFDASGGVPARVGLVACNALMRMPGGELGRVTLRDVVGSAEGLTVARLLESNSVFVSALCPRVAVEEAGGFSPEAFGSEDHDLWIKLLELGWRSVATAEPLAIYRLAPGSLSANRVGMAKTSQTTYRLALERGRLSPRDRRLARRLQRLHAAVEAIERLRGPGARRDPAALAQALGALAVFGAHALSHPGRWPRWARSLLRGRGAVWRPSGPTGLPLERS